VSKAPAKPLNPINKLKKRDNKEPTIHKKVNKG